VYNIFLFLEIRAHKHTFQTCTVYMICCINVLILWSTYRAHVFNRIHNFPILNKGVYTIYGKCKVVISDLAFSHQIYAEKYKFLSANSAIVLNTMIYFDNRWQLQSATRMEASEVREQNMQRRCNNLYLVYRKNLIDLI